MNNTQRPEWYTNTRLQSEIYFVMRLLIQTDFLANIEKNSADERKRKHKPKQWLSQLKTE